MQNRRFLRRRRRSGLRYAGFRVKHLLSGIGKTFLSLRPAVRIACAATGALIITGLVLLLSLPTGGEPVAGDMRQAALPQAAQGAESTLLDFPGTSTPDMLPTSTPAPTPTPDPTLYKGVADGEHVTKLQERLMDLGYLDIDEPTEHFGPATEYAVQLFQRQHALQEDGIAGPMTLDMIYEPNAKKYTLLEGTRGTDVDNFQRQLKDLGYLNKVTGYYGDETVAAVKAFQKQNGLKEDGKAGQKTFDTINSDKAKPSPAMANEKRRKANIDTMIKTAEKQIGKKYILGNVGPKSFDCSGLVYYCLKEAGSNRRRLNAAGYSTVSDWEKITSYSKLKKGDLLFFQNNARTKVGHVGIYIGNGMMIDASSANGKVVKRSATTSYWKSHFVCARRPW